MLYSYATSWGKYRFDQVANSMKGFLYKITVSYKNIAQLLDTMMILRLNFT